MRWEHGLGAGSSFHSRQQFITKTVSGQYRDCLWHAGPEWPDRDTRGARLGGFDRVNTSRPTKSALYSNHGG
jgi:hypothetical protein